MSLRPALKLCFPVALGFVTYLCSDGLAAVQRRLLSLFVAVVVAWAIEALPMAVTALLIAPALIALGICGPQQAFAAYADPVLFLFVGAFFIARAMRQHGLDRRAVHAALSARWSKGRTHRATATLVGLAGLLSMWMSNTATAAMLTPLVQRVEGRDAGQARQQHGDAQRSVLSLAYACSVGGLATLVGSPPNLIAVGMLRDSGYAMGFFRWMALTAPVVVAMLAVLIVAELRAESHGRAIEPEAVGQRWDFGQWSVATSLGLAIAGWLSPALIRWCIPSGQADWIAKRMHSGAVALGAASLLFALRDRRGVPVLSWGEASKIDWGIVYLFGGGLALGRQLLDTGLAATLARGFVESTGISGLWELTAAVVAVTIVLTEVASNTACASVLAPWVIAIAQHLGVSPVPPMLALAWAASCAFMLPVATGPNAIAYATGKVPMRTMLRRGVVLNGFAAVLIWSTLRAWAWWGVGGL